MSSTGDPLAPNPHTTAAMTVVEHQDDESASEVVETGTKGERGKFLPRVKGLLSKENEEVSSSHFVSPCFPFGVVSRCQSYEFV